MLLKNSAGALPLDPSALRSIAVIGPHANYSQGLAGDYYGDWVCPNFSFDCLPTIAAAVKTVLQGSSASVAVAAGVSVTGDSTRFLLNK